VILRCWPLLIIVASWIWGISLWLRLAEYQTEHPGEPYMWNWKFLNPNNFTADGQPILYRLDPPSGDPARDPPTTMCP